MLGYLASSKTPMVEASGYIAVDVQTLAYGII